jgi:hypothetical protein
MLAKTALIALAVGLCDPAAAGVLSATDIQRLEDYERFVAPGSREIPALQDMAARVGALAAAAESAGEAPDDARRSALRSEIGGLPVIGGPILERMVASLQAIDDPAAFAAPEWAVLLAEVQAEIAERLAYDAGLMKAYQASVATGRTGLGRSLPSWGERPGAAERWRRFERILERGP